MSGAATHDFRQPRKLQAGVAFRRLTRWATLLSAFILLPALLVARQTERFFFVQLADPQFGMYRIGKDFKHEREHVAKAVAAINRLRPEFVVVCGDLVNRTGNKKQIAAFKEAFAALDPSIPLYLVAGNHDVGNRPTPKSLKAYRAKFGADRYAFERHGVRFIVLNSSLLKDPRSARTEAKEQAEWLRGALGAGGWNGRTIVFLHHPPFIRKPAESDKYENLPEPARMDLLRAFEARGVTNVFAGHVHRNAGGTYKNVEVTASGAVGLPMGLDPAGLRVVVVGPDGVRHKYFGLDSIPDRIDLSAAEPF